MSIPAATLSHISSADRGKAPYRAAKCVGNEPLDAKAGAALAQTQWGAASLERPADVQAAAGAAGANRQRVETAKGTE